MAIDADLSSGLITEDEAKFFTDIKLYLYGSQLRLKILQGWRLQRVF